MLLFASLIVFRFGASRASLYSRKVVAAGDVTRQSGGGGQIAISHLRTGEWRRQLARRLRETPPQCRSRATLAPYRARACGGGAAQWRRRLAAPVAAAPRRKQRQVERPAPRANPASHMSRCAGEIVECVTRATCGETGWRRRPSCASRRVSASGTSELRCLESATRAAPLESAWRVCGCAAQTTTTTRGATKEGHLLLAARVLAARIRPPRRARAARLPISRRAEGDSLTAKQQVQVAARQQST